jgi:hypothetical protein
MHPNSSRRAHRDEIREAAAYPLPFTTGKIKAFDKTDQKRRRALRCLVLSGVAVLLVLAWMFG